MNSVTHEAVELIRDELSGMSPSERVELFNEVVEGYCPACGVPLRDGEICHCENDE